MFFKIYRSRNKDPNYDSLDLLLLSSISHPTSGGKGCLQGVGENLGEKRTEETIYSILTS